MRFQQLTVAMSAVLLAVLMWGMAGRWAAVRRAEASVRLAALARDSIEAARDTTRLVSVDGIAAESEHLRVVQRRAMQAEQRADALDHALGGERVARIQLAATLTVLRAEVRSETVYVDREQDDRHAVFEIREAPYTVRAEVVLPAPPEAGRISVRVDLDTLVLDVRLSCGETHGAGVRPASATVSGPAWAPVRLGQVEQAVDVCSSPRDQPAARRGSVLRAIAERFGASAGYAMVREPSGRVVAGPAVAAGFRVWP